MMIFTKYAQVAWSLSITEAFNAGNNQYKNRREVYVVRCIRAESAECVWRKRTWKRREIRWTYCLAHVTISSFDLNTTWPGTYLACRRQLATSSPSLNAISVQWFGATMAPAWVMLKLGRKLGQKPHRSTWWKNCTISHWLYCHLEMIAARKDFLYARTAMMCEFWDHQTPQMTKNTRQRREPYRNRARRTVPVAKK